ncbi:hypothetical protein GRI44_13210 [Altererythrobacter confluentis]|uniref:Uncharacterized protein n=1 Tax=Allopontixanthobacter confluentis TaxID=1849021 RepID=A0A6L7GLF0_9SPHN|nr:hypothetical protein [Allopontixanthobacter confluentis]MXP15708.1 hypothetical protein [Allopontixanthobacter confluentis]
MKRLLIAASLIVLVSAASATAQDERPLSETCPDLTAEEIEAIENYQGQFSENAWYARAYCVSVEEAERRMEIQNRGAIGPRTEPGPAPLPPAPDADLGTLQATLREKEADTFAGLWIQHEPTYGVAVAFTRNAAATLGRYTSDPLFTPVERSGPTLIELRATQDRIVKDLIRLGFAWNGAGASEITGKVEIDLAQSAGPIREAAARGEIDIPDYVVFKEPAPFPIAAPPVPSGDTRVRSFPQFARRTDGGISTLVGVPDVPARLTLRDGCLWLEPEGEEPKIAVWEQHEAIDLTDPERVAIMNRFSGAKVVADSDVVLMGLQPGEVTPPTDVIGSEGCPGPYRVVRGIVPRELWDAQRRESGIAGRQQELGSRAAAEADYTADMARVAELRAWRGGILPERGDVVAQIYIDENKGTAHMFHTGAATREQLVPSALRPFVTAQIVPQGGRALSRARDDIAAQMAQASLTGDIYVEPIGGYVGVRVSDLASFSQAAVEGRLVIPPFVRLEMDNQSAVYRQDIALRRDPEAIWYPLEAHPDFAAIRALVAETPIMRPEPPRPGEIEGRLIAQKPSPAGSLQQTHFLIAFGRSLREIEALRAAGFDPITAQEDMNGRQTVQTRALVASDIVVAESVGIDIADSGSDGFSSSVRWRVVEVLKGSASVGGELRQRLASGERTDEAGVTRYGQGMDEPVLLPGLPNALEPGSRWVLHLSDALYRHMSFVQGGEGAARTEGKWLVATSTPPARLDADDIARPVSLYPEPMSLVDLREAIAPIQTALVSAGLVEGAQ